MATKTRKPKPAAPKPAAPSPYRKLQLTAPELVSWEGRRSGCEPWVWMGQGITLPRAAQVRFLPFQSPGQQLIDGATGKRLTTITTTLDVKGMGGVVLAAAGVGGKAMQLVNAVPSVLTELVADCYAGTLGNGMSDEPFHPTAHGRKLVRWCELALLGIAAVVCRSGAVEACPSDFLADAYAESWEWADDRPVNPKGSPVRLDDPRTW